MTDLYADLTTVRRAVQSAHQELDSLAAVLECAVSPEGATALRVALEQVNTVDYEPDTHGPLMAWAAETVTYLEAERSRHADEGAAVHRLLRESGHLCTRGSIVQTLARVLGSADPPPR